MVLWTQEHLMTLLPAVVVMIGASLLLRHFLGKKDEKVRRIPLQIIAVVLLLLEIGKQAVSFSRGYDLYNIPLHFCSLMLVAIPAMAFYNGKHTRIVDGVATALCASVTLLTLVYPDLIYGSWHIKGFFEDYLCMHTVVFHNLVIFAFMLILALDLYTPQPKGEWRATMAAMAVYCAVAAPMAQILQTNYNNFYSCNIAPLEAVRQSLQPVLGDVFTQILYVLIVVVLDLAFVSMCHFLSRGLYKLLTPKQPVPVETK